jgi:hypothetical protein
MAENLMDYMKELEATEPQQFAAPQIRYGAKEDSLFYYFRTEESCAKRLDGLVTIFVSLVGDRLVGCQIKGLMRKLKSDGHFGVAIKSDGKIELGLFFHLLAYDFPELESRNQLVELGQQAKGIEINLEQDAVSN